MVLCNFVDSGQRGLIKKVTFELRFEGVEGVSIWVSKEECSRQKE